MNKYKVTRKIEEEIIISANSEEEAVEQSNFVDINGILNWQKTGVVSHMAKKVENGN